MKVAKERLFHLVLQGAILALVEPDFMAPDRPHMHSGDSRLLSVGLYSVVTATLDIACAFKGRGKSLAKRIAECPPAKCPTLNLRK